MIIHRASPQETRAAHTWLQLQGWPEQPQWSFPDLCYVVPGKAAVWLFTSNSGMAWVEYLVANPLISDKSERKQAISDLLQYVGQEAKSMGIRGLITSTPHPGAARAFEAAGYIAGDTGCTQYIKRL